MPPLTTQNKRDIVCFAYGFGRSNFSFATTEIDRLAALMGVTRPSGSGDDIFGVDLSLIIMGDHGTATGRFA